MGFDDNGRYRRTSRVNGRYVCKYVGSGIVAEIASKLDILRRQSRLHQQSEVRQTIAELEEFDAADRALDQWARQVARAAMFAAGYRQHHRGDWRRRRGKAT
jgi:predicted NBD/HSP70 family sugar kinase